MSVIKIATLNVDGINDYNKCLSIFNALKNLNCEIIALQETHIAQKDIDKVKALWPNDSVWNPAPNSYSCGSAILLGARAVRKGFKFDNNGRISTVKIKYDENIIQLTNVYAPNDNKHREDFFNQI